MKLVKGESPNLTATFEVVVGPLISRLAYILVSGISLDF